MSGSAVSRFAVALACLVVIGLGAAALVAFAAPAPNVAALFAESVVSSSETGVAQAGGLMSRSQLADSHEVLMRGQDFTWAAARPKLIGRKLFPIEFTYGFDWTRRGKPVELEWMSVTVRWTDLGWRVVGWGVGG